MNLLSELLQRVQNIADVSVRSEEHFIEVTPTSDTGFSVSIYQTGEYYTVGFSGYHDTLKDREEAKQLFLLGLSNNCRLHVTSRGNTEYHWLLEKREEGKWVKFGKLGSIIPVPFWKKKKVLIYQNNII